MTRECHAGILREPGGEIPPGHPTCRVLREGAAVSEKYSLIDAEYENAIADKAKNAPSEVISEKMDRTSGL